MSFTLVLEHLFLVVASSLLSIIIGIPLGILSYLAPKARAVILRVVDLLQTIPSLALLGIIMVFVGPGKLTVVTGITLYSLLPIVRNTYLGLHEVDSGIKDAARGMGMTTPYRIFVVEFPLAFPTIITGIRIAIVNAIGTAVFAAFVGGGGIGSVLYNGIRTQKLSIVLLGTAALMAIAIVIDVLMSLFENSVRKNKGTSRRQLIPTVIICVLIFALLLPFGITSVESNELLMYDGDYSETKIMTRMAKYLIEDRSDLTVTIMDEMTSVNNFKAMVGSRSSCDLMFSYDGTVLTTYLGLDPTDVPDNMTLYDYANQVVYEEYGARLLNLVGLNNTYAIAVTQDVVNEYNVSKVSDLIDIADQLVFGAEHAFFTLEGSMKYGPFCEYYGLNFKDAVSVDINLKYIAVESGSFNVTEVYTTDGLNVEAGLVVLEDDLNFFPEYNGAYLVLEDTLTRFPDVPIEDILNELTGMISNEDMTQMTYLTDVQGYDVDYVALQFLLYYDMIEDPAASSAAG